MRAVTTCHARSYATWSLAAVASEGNGGCGAYRSERDGAAMVLWKEEDDGDMSVMVGACARPCCWVAAWEKTGPDCARNSPGRSAERTPCPCPCPWPANG